MPYGWIFGYFIRDGRSTKVAKIMVVHWHLTFLQQGQVCFPMHLYGKKCSEFQTTSPLESLGQCCSNFIWSLPGAGEWKIAKMVAIHWPRWPPCPFVVKTFKNLLLQNQGCLVAESYWINYRDGRSTEIAKIMAVHWHLTFLWRGQVCFAMDLYGKKCWEFQMTSPLEPLGQCCSNFIWSLPGAGEWKIAKIVAVHWPRWLPCPYMVKTFKNLLLQNQGCLMAESLHKSSGRGGLPKLLKWWLYIDIWPFYCKVVCFWMHLYGPLYLYGKKCW